MPPKLDFDARLSFDVAGTPVSDRYGDIYRSRSGAWDEAQQVFIAGCGLQRRWNDESASHDRFCILELGFGLGVNFLATRALHSAARNAPHRLNYVAIEAHPVQREELVKAHHTLGLSCPEIAHFARELQDRWPMRTPGVHRLSFDHGRIVLLLAFGDVSYLLPRLSLAADAIFLDGFSPSRNPAMWEPSVMSQLARLSRPGATLATYSVARSVCERLEAVGFQPSIAHGYGTKRQRLVASYAPKWRSYPPPPKVPNWPDRRALVIGAGLAGSAIAGRLHEEGWAVSLFDTSGEAASGGSGQPWCADHVHVSPDDNVLARSTRAALYMAIASRQRLSAYFEGEHNAGPSFWNASGRLVLPADAASVQQQKSLLARLELPDTFVRFVDATAASDLAGIRLATGGLWFPISGAISPRRLITHRIAPLAALGSLRLGCDITRIYYDGSCWNVFDRHGQPMGQAPVLVLAASFASLRLAGMSSVDLRRVRGQTTWVRSDRLQGLRVSLGGSAYVVPDGERALVGASFDDGDRLAPSSDSDASNLRRLWRLLQADEMSASCTWQSAEVGFRYTSPDRMPLIGQVPDEEEISRHAQAFTRNARLPLPRRSGLYTVSALGSRGALWSELAAEVIVAQLLGDPSPIESDLLAAVDPARAIRQALRRDGKR